MQVDWFGAILVPVVGGLGIFMLGLEFMTSGIQSLAVNRMRSLLGKMAGTPIKGLAAGTLITGVIQSSTAMTVMVVGLVNAGVLALRPAISVIMGANIGTTLTNTLIALPLGPLGLLVGGFFALVYVFSNKENVKNIALASMGFCLIFYGLSMMTGGLRPLRNIPEVMGVISSLKADSYLSILYCVLTAAVLTALIHSSSATIGIVMGLGASGVLGWETALAFSLGADLGTTITSFIASLNLSKNAKRAAYAHISFNFIGVAVMLPLFPLATQLIAWFLGDPGVPVVNNGQETFPLVPVAVGLYSTAFNVFNTILLFPFIGVFERVLSRVGRTVEEDIEDYSVPRFLDHDNRGDLARAVPSVQREQARYLEGAALFLRIARNDPKAPSDVREHAASCDILSREIREYAASLFRPGLGHREADLVASLIEEADHTASLGETLHQIARRVRREEGLSPDGQAIVEAMQDELGQTVHALAREDSALVAAADHVQGLLRLRARVLEAPAGVTPHERGAILALLGSAERAYLLSERIDAERRSVPRTVAARVTEAGPLPALAVPAAPAR